MTQESVFLSNSGGYSCYKIPTIFRTSNGTLLAFSEARRGGCMDWDITDLVMRKSYDGGDTWLPKRSQR